MSRKFVILALCCSGVFLCARKVLPPDDQWAAPGAHVPGTPTADEPTNPDARVRHEDDDVQACKRLLARDDNAAVTRGNGRELR